MTRPVNFVLLSVMMICLSACAEVPKPDALIQTKEQAIKAGIGACFDDHGGFIPSWGWTAKYEDGIWTLYQHSAFDYYGVAISAQTGKPTRKCAFSTE